MERSILSYSLCLITYAIKCQGFTNAHTKLISHILVSQSLSGLLFFQSGRRQSMFFNSSNRKCPQGILEGRMALRFCVVVKPLLGTLFHNIIARSLRKRCLLPSSAAPCHCLTDPSAALPQLLCSLQLSIDFLVRKSSLRQLCLKVAWSFKFWTVLSIYLNVSV